MFPIVLCYEDKANKTIVVPGVRDIIPRSVFCIPFACLFCIFSPCFQASAYFLLTESKNKLVMELLLLELLFFEGHKYKTNYLQHHDKQQYNIL